MLQGPPRLFLHILHIRFPEHLYEHAVVSTFRTQYCNSLCYVTHDADGNRRTVPRRVIHRDLTLSHQLEAHIFVEPVGVCRD